MCQDALLVIDLQNDFLPGGALAVPEGLLHPAIPAANPLKALRFHTAGRRCGPITASRAQRALPFRLILTPRPPDSSSAKA